MRLPTRLLRRKNNVHKGDFGHIFILAGSARFSGAAALCSEAALRAGAGLVTLGIPRSLNQAIIKIKAREVMTLPLPETSQASLSLAAYKKIKEFLRNIDIVVIGPGLGQENSTRKLVLRLITESHKPMVVDADGLNALVGHLGRVRNKKEKVKSLIFTPHPGEMVRLAGLSIIEVQRKRKDIAQNFARRHKVTLVLKGHNTVVADYSGRLYINRTGNPGMATAGCGDVLSGMIAAFLGQGLDAFNAAKYAVYLHGLAGDLAQEEKTQISLIASDIIARIPEAIKKCS